MPSNTNPFRFRRTRSDNYTGWDRCMQFEEWARHGLGKVTDSSKMTNDS